MDIGTISTDRIINVGSADTLYSLYSTAKTLAGRHTWGVSLGLDFLKSGSCNARNCAKTAKQLSEINTMLAGHAPDDAIWDIERPNASAPWSGNLAPTVTSCADLYTTSEGELLLPELVSLLRFADSTKQDVIVLG